MDEPAERPAEGEERPWEEPGSCRMDCEPHRGNLLALLGTLSLVCGALSLCLGVPGLVGLPLGLATSWMAQRDLALMKAGRMDPGGQAQAVRADTYGMAAAVVSVVGCCSAAALLFHEWRLGF